MSRLPMRKVPRSTPGPASQRTCAAHFLNVCHSSENADSNTSAGRNTESMVCGPMATHMSSELESTPRSRYEYENPMASPTKSSATV